ncbi:hypothetical protein CYLTODRAFT_460369, partial [Cylindrobasidium torrendii FP15055 ss-10]
MLCAPLDFASTGPVRPQGIPSTHPLARVASDFSGAYYTGKAYRSAQATQYFKALCRIHLDLTWQMNRRTSASRHLERLYARFEDWIWPLVEWGVLYRAAIFENGIWRLRTPEEVDMSPRMRPRPRPVSVHSSTSSADRMSVDAALRPPSPGALSAMDSVDAIDWATIDRTRVKDEPVSPSIGQHIKLEPVTPSRVKLEP